MFTYANDGQGRDHRPFTQPQFLLLNLALGDGGCGHKGIDDTIFQAEFRIDYVRV